MLDQNQSRPIVEVTVSRPTYRLGGTVVGSIRVMKRAKDVVTTEISPIRDGIDSLQLSAAGFCRLDPRWHPSAKHGAPTSSSNVKDTNMLSHDGLPQDMRLPPHTSPFWSAGTIDLMNLHERTFGRWEDARPKPIVLPGRTSLNGQQNRILQANVVEAGSENDKVLLEESQLAFTFRVDLPLDAPHSLVAASCRYYYLIIVRLQTIATNSVQDPEWIHFPVTVLTADPNRSQTVDEVPYNRTPIQAMAHSSGLPTQLTASELNEMEGQYTVGRHGAALYRTCASVPQQQQPRPGVQSLRVVDPASGRPACLLTLLTSPAHLHPGSRLTLQLDFPRKSGEIDRDNEWVPCYQASACLQGEEVVLVSHSGGNSGGASRRRVARRHILSTAHERLDFHTTESVPLNLIVPETALCTIQTDAVDISVQCVIDIAVGTTTSASSGTDFRNLHLEIPCNVVHAVSDWESKNDVEEASGERAFQAILESLKEPCDDPLDPRSFRTSDIQDELKILSLNMVDSCGLRPKPCG